MVADNDELVNLKKADGVEALSIFAGVTVTDVPVSEFREVTTAVAAAVSKLTALTNIVKSSDTDVPAVDKAETLSKVMLEITIPLMLLEVTDPSTFVVSQFKESCVKPERTVQAAVLPV